MPGRARTEPRHLADTCCPTSVAPCYRSTNFSTIRGVYATARGPAFAAPTTPRRRESRDGHPHPPALPPPPPPLPPPRPPRPPPPPRPASPPPAHRPPPT